MDRKTVKKVARLARLELNDTQEERLVEQLGNIIGFKRSCYFCGMW